MPVSFVAVAARDPPTGRVPGRCAETKTGQETSRIQRHGEGAELSVLILCCAGPREPGVRVSEAETSPLAVCARNWRHARSPRMIPRSSFDAPSTANSVEIRSDRSERPLIAMKPR